MLKRIALLSTCLVLAGCGDGGGGESAVVSTGSTASAPTPTPAPTTPLNTDEPRPVTGETQLSSTLQFFSNGSSTSSRSNLIDTPNFSIGFDTVAQRYTVADSTGSASFGSSELTDNTSVPAHFPHVEFTLKSASATDYLVIFKALNASPPVTSKYGGLGAWQHDIPAANGTQTKIDWFLYGSATPVSAMPTSGVVHYRLVGDGNVAQDSQLFAASTDIVVFTADFGAGTVNAQVGLEGADFFKGTTGGLLGFNVIGTIAGNGVTGATQSAIATQTGRFRILFLGPNAEEVALIAEGQDPSQAFAVAAVGVRQN